MQIFFGSVVDMEPRYSLWMIFPQKLLLSEHAHDRRIHPLCTGIPKWLCCTFFQTTQIESKRKNNPLCLMTLLSEQSYNPLAVKVRQPRQRTMYTKYIMLYYMCTYLSRQSHHRDVPRWEVFMEQELRFGLDLGLLAVLKKGPGLIMSNF